MVDGALQIQAGIAVDEDAGGAAARARAAERIAGQDDDRARRRLRHGLADEEGHAPTHTRPRSIPAGARARPRWRVPRNLRLDALRRSRD